jgi:hypothetical protein
MNSRIHLRNILPRLFRRFASTTSTTARLPCMIALASVVSLAGISESAHANAFKCQAADGRVEYSDRPCETTKSTLDTPKKNGSITSRPTVKPMEQLEKLFAEFEPALCERERLSAEIDRANRTGVFKADSPEWKPKQDRMYFLNDERVKFSTRAGKITEPTGRDSLERAAVMKFQMMLKNCDRPPAGPILKPEVKSATPALTAPAAPSAASQTTAPAKAAPTKPASNTASK